MVSLLLMFTLSPLLFIDRPVKIPFHSKDRLYSAYYNCLYADKDVKLKSSSSFSSLQECNDALISLGRNHDYRGFAKSFCSLFFPNEKCLVAIREVKIDAGFKGREYTIKNIEVLREYRYPEKKGIVCTKWIPLPYDFVDNEGMVKNGANALLIRFCFY